MVRVKGAGVLVPYVALYQIADAKPCPNRFATWVL